MEQPQVPIGFGMALAQHEEAMNAFAMMTKEQKQNIWAQARQARSREEMQHIIEGIVTK